MSAAAPAGDVATVTVFVAVAPDVAFEVFTAEMDLWWRHGPKFRIAGKRRGALHLEPGLGGRLFESFEDAGGEIRTHELGRVLVWDPPALLGFEWRGVNFAPGQSTRVDVRFVAQGEGTLVTVRHAGWSALPAGHPVRHGLEGAAFSRRIGMWWGDLMTSLREHAGARRP